MFPSLLFNIQSLILHTYFPTCPTYSLYSIQYFSGFLIISFFISFDLDLFNIYLYIMNLKAIVLSLLFVVFTISVDPPVLADSFQIAFDETFIQNGTHYRVNGQLYYDAKNNRERVDRTNGRYSIFCGTVLPNVTTSCTHLTVNNKRYIVFPQRRQCCYCCDSQHGCGILKKNWLEGAQFLGPERIVDTNYNKWSKDGVVGYNHYWVTIDQNSIPRRLDENGNHITDYLVHTFINKTFDDTYFAVPNYCNETCPATSFCGKFQKEQNLLVD